jgi:hypothetical protein
MTTVNNKLLMALMCSDTKFLVFGFFIVHQLHLTYVQTAKAVQHGRFGLKKKGLNTMGHGWYNLL